MKISVRKSLKTKDIFFLVMGISSGDQGLSQEVEKLKQDFQRLRKEQRKLHILSILICIATAILFFLIGYYFPHPLAI